MSPGRAGVSLCTKDLGRKPPHSVTPFDPSELEERLSNVFVACTWLAPARAASTIARMSRWRVQLRRALSLQSSKTDGLLSFQNDLDGQLLSDSAGHSHYNCITR